MSGTVQAMREKLAVLEPQQLEIIDDSALHAGHAGARQGGGHYRLGIVSAHFAGRGTAERHRLIYSALGAMMRGPIHALSIQALTPDETD